MFCKKILLPFIFIIMLSATSSGQAVRLTYLGYNSFEKFKGNSNLYVALGYEQNIRERIALSVEYKLGYPNFLAEDEGGYYGYNSTIQGFKLSSTWYEIEYNSKFFFRDIEDGSCYLSTAIAYRPVKVTVDYSIYDSNQGITFPEQHLTKSYAFTPVSFRFGYRNRIDGLFSDYYIGVTFLPGGADKEFGVSEVDSFVRSTPEESFFSNTSFSFGIAFGLGWAD